MVRLYAKEAATELANIIGSVKSDSRETNTGLTDEFATSAGDKLDDIFQD
jgi:hypothetical protein